MTDPARRIKDDDITQRTTSSSGLLLHWWNTKSVSIRAELGGLVPPDWTDQGRTPRPTRRQKDARRCPLHAQVTGGRPPGGTTNIWNLVFLITGAKPHHHSARLVTYCSCWSSAWTAACGSSAGPSSSPPAGGPAPSPCSSPFSNQLYSQAPLPPPQRFMSMPTRLCSGEAPPPRKGPCTKFLAMMSLPAIEQS